MDIQLYFKNKIKQLLGLSNNKDVSYSAWIKSIEGESFVRVGNGGGDFCISFLLFVEEASISLLKQTIDSIVNQEINSWELILVTDIGINFDSLGVQASAVTVIYEEKLATLNKYSCINNALRSIQSDWVTFLDVGDLISPFFMPSISRIIDESNTAEGGKYSAIKIIYTDEDYLERGERHNPCFKPDWNPDYLDNYNYFSKGVVYQKDCFNDVGGFNSESDSPYHDLALRVTKGLAGKQILHIPHVLFHFLLPIEPEVILRRRYNLAEPVPLVSIIIPTKDSLDLLKPCVEGVLEDTAYKNIEVIIIDNNSRDLEVLEYLSDLEHDARVLVMHYADDFNFSEMNNQAVKMAKGELICFLNNDISIIKDDWLHEMTSNAQRSEIGCVGAKLYYPDGMIQHAGVILGLKGYASHAHKGFEGNSKGYFNRLVVTHNVSAVTAACLLVKKSIFNKVGGFDDKNLKIAYNDVDFCLKVREAGYRNLFTPHAELIHHESKSRGKKRNKEQKKQLKRESDYLVKKWGEHLFSDPAYNPNLTLLREDFSLGLDRIEHD